MKVSGCVVAVAIGTLGCGALPKPVNTSTSTETTAPSSRQETQPPSGGGVVVDQDAIQSGIETTNMLGADPPGFRVTWIRWDSGFRGTDLRIGDRIIAVNGERYVKPPKLEDLQRMLPKVIGGYAESQHWKERGARDGTDIELTVVRRAASGTGVETAKVRGKLLADRVYPDGMRRRIGPNGPDGLERDGFDSAWSSWYEARVRDWGNVLDRDWTPNQVNSRVALARHLEEKPRVDLLAKKYPGQFASAVGADWTRVRESLVGRRYQLSDRDLAYRQLGEQRAGEIAAAGTKAREAFLVSVKGDTITPFPTVDPIRGDRKSVANKVVILPEIGTSRWISEGGHGYFAIGDRGSYFVDLEKPEARRMFEAQFRYQKYVQPKLSETYAVIGRINPTPRVLVVNGRASSGYEVTPVGVTIGNAMYVDLTVVNDGTSPFAGERALHVPSRPPIRDTASPREVMAAFFDALKVGDESTWRALYATWWAEDWKEEGILYHPFYQYRLESEWIRARRQILGSVYDVAVVYVSNPKKIVKGTEFPKAPVIEQVTVEVEHVGKFDGEYRAFTDINVHRLWLLQRRDGGPWRIAGGNGL